MRTTGLDRGAEVARARAHDAPGRTTRRTLVAAMLAASAIGCESDAAADPFAESGLDGYTVSGTPTLVLDDDGTPDRLFTRIAARRTAGGEIAVADIGTSEIRLFGRDGRLVRMLARRGSGPGELGGDVLVTSHADTIFTFGRPPMSPPDVNVFVAGQGFVSRFRPQPANARAVTTLERLTTGHLVVQRGTGFRILNSIPDAGQLVPDSAVYGLLPASEGEARGDVAWLDPLVRAWTVTHPWPGGPLPSAMSEFELGPRTMIVASGDRLWLVDGATGRLRAVDGAGQEVATGQLSLQPQPFDRALLDRRQARDLAAAARALDSARVRAMYDPALLPATAPLVSAAHAGADGEIWLRLFDLDETAPQRFVIVGRDGAELARATIPATLEVQQIGADFVLGVSRDSVGVESVREHALRRR